MEILNMFSYLSKKPDAILISFFIAVIIFLLGKVSNQSNESYGRYHPRSNPYGVVIFSITFIGIIFFFTLIKQDIGVISPESNHTPPNVQKDENSSVSRMDKKESSPESAIISIPAPVPRKENIRPPKKAKTVFFIQRASYRTKEYALQNQRNLSRAVVLYCKQDKQYKLGHYFHHQADVDLFISENEKTFLEKPYISRISVNSYSIIKPSQSK